MGVVDFVVTGTEHR
jgi:hypothetical protein